MMYAGAPLHTRGRLGLPGHGAATAHLVVTMVPHVLRSCLRCGADAYM